MSPFLLLCAENAKATWRTRSPHYVPGPEGQAIRRKVRRLKKEWGLEQ